jgi:hypothetical protein
MIQLVMTLAVIQMDLPMEMTIGHESLSPLSPDPKVARQQSHLQLHWILSGHNPECGLQHWRKRCILGMNMNDVVAMSGKRVRVNGMCMVSDFFFRRGTLLICCDRENQTPPSPMFPLRDTEASP